MLGPVLIELEEFTLKNESKSGAGASTVTVATLSHDRHNLIKPRQNLERSQLIGATNRLVNGISQPMLQENAAPRSSHLSRTISVSLTDNNLLNDAPTPRPCHPTVSSHNVLPDPDFPWGSSIRFPQSVSRIGLPLSSLIEFTNQRSSCVMWHLLTVLTAEYQDPYNRTPQTISSSTATRSISSFSFPSINESLTSEEPEDMGQDSSNEGSQPICDVENASSMTATTDTHIAPRFSIGSSSYRGVGGSNAVGSGADIGTGSLSPASLLHPSPFYVTLST